MNGLHLCACSCSKTNIQPTRTYQKSSQKPLYPLVLSKYPCKNCPLKYFIDRTSRWWIFPLRQKWRVPEIGLPPVIINFYMGFSIINQSSSLVGYPIYGNPHHFNGIVHYKSFTLMEFSIFSIYK